MGKKFWYFWVGRKPNIELIYINGMEGGGKFPIFVWYALAERDWANATKKLYCFLIVFY